MSFAIFESNSKSIKLYIQLSSQYFEKNIDKCVLLFFLLSIIRRRYWMKNTLFSTFVFNEFFMMRFAEILSHDHRFWNLIFLLEQWTIVDCEKTSNLNSKLFIHAACEWSHRKNFEFRILLFLFIVRQTNEQYKFISTVFERCSWFHSIAKFCFWNTKKNKHAKQWFIIKYQRIETQKKKIQSWTRAQFHCLIFVRIYDVFIIFITIQSFRDRKTQKKNDNKNDAKIYFFKFIKRSRVFRRRIAQWRQHRMWFFTWFLFRIEMKRFDFQMHWCFYKFNFFIFKC